MRPGGLPLKSSVVAAVKARWRSTEHRMASLSHNRKSTASSDGRPGRY